MPRAPKEPIARGIVVALPAQHREQLDALAKDALSILRALNAPGANAPDVPPTTDYLVLLIEADSALGKLALPDMRDRAATVIAVGERSPETRAAIADARKRLRGAGATLGARELVFAPSDFGYLGLESDGLREKLEEILSALAPEAERLRLKREGWEEPDARETE